VEQRRSVRDSDGADGTGFEAGEPTAGDKAEDGTSEELEGGVESLTGLG
jgi:hypothetical protein